MLTNQTLQQVEHIYREWIANHAPKDLYLDSAAHGKPASENIAALSNYVQLYYGGIVSITALNAAVAALSDLNRKPKMTAAEFESIELRRRQREAQENSVDWKEKNKSITDAQIAKKENDKQQEIARNAINTAIESYECYRGPGRRDYGEMNKRKTQLRTYRDANKHRDQKIVLDEVRTMILNFPDPNERMR